jgi:FkbM family methyltransferase
MELIANAKLNISDARRMGVPFLLRHIARRDADRVHCVKIAGFGRIHVRDDNSDIDVLRQIFKFRHYALNDDLMRRAMKRYSEILENRKIPVIVDAGANIGAASIWFNSLYPHSRVVAVEPEQGNLSVLRRNIRPGITLLEAAVGGSPGFVSVESSSRGWAAQTERSESGTQIVTMAQAFGAIEAGIPFIAKIDIEGFEDDLFSRNLDWLDEVSIIFVEPHDWLLPGKKTSRSFQRAMGSRDFDLFICGENLVYVR